MQVAYQPWLVLLSLLMAIPGGYVGFALAGQIGATVGLRRRLLLAGAAFALTVGVWCMQFTGMLAVRLPFPVDYLAFPTLLSFLICVIVVGIAIFVVGGGPLTSTRLVVAACLLGTGIALLHYIGMAALAASAVMTDAPAAVIASLAVAMAASALALRLAMQRRAPLIVPAVIFAMAVSAMHYIAMVGTTFFPRPLTALAPALSPGLLAIVVAAIAFCSFSVFLLLLVPDRPPAAAEIPTAAAGTPVLAENATADVTVGVAGGDSDLRRGIFAPLGGAGAPPPRIAEQLPIERDGATHFVPVERVVAVHANAHYTFLFDGTAKLFCPLAIGEVESRLDRGRFMRVHRSHIVNIDRVVGTKKSGDGEIVELAADTPYTVPVSRSRAGWLKSRIAEKNGGLRQGR
jgi:NO-binding membrane sensor protein with MHYT domain